jgi:hypothetical protein
MLEKIRKPNQLVHWLKAFSASSIHKLEHKQPTPDQQRNRDGNAAV